MCYLQCGSNGVNTVLRWAIDHHSFLHTMHLLTSDAQAALAPGKHHHHHHRHHHHHHRVPTEQELANRRLPGSQVTLGGQRKISLQQEEDDVGLPAADLENITSEWRTK